jgi:hypothetical protein
MSPTIFWPGLSAVKARAGGALLGQRAPPRPGLARHQAQLAHQPPDELGAAQLAAPGQQGVQPPVAVLAVIRVEQCLDLYFQKFPSSGSRRFRP